MKRAQREINAILDDVPRFRFNFPDVSKTRNLEAETRRRQSKRKRSNKMIERKEKMIGEFLNDPELIEAASSESLERLSSELERLKEALRQRSEN